MTEEIENGRVVGTDLEGQPVMEPFDHDTAPHHITFGGVTGGTTFGVPHRIIIGQTRAGRTCNTRSQRFAEMFDEDEGEGGGGDEDRTFIEVAPDGEMSEIEHVETINPLDIPAEPMDDEEGA